MEKIRRQMMAGESIFVAVEADQFAMSPREAEMWTLKWEFSE